jgi:hypothetical protein
MPPESAPTAMANGPGAGFRPQAAPFLYWPVSRREFYRTICVALAPAVAWGVIVFGGRVLAMLVLAVAASSVTCVGLQYGLKWRRAQAILYVHCLLSDLVLVSLAHPTWPVWFVTVLALLMPLVLVVLGGSGKERVHVAAALALAAQYIVLPAMAPTMYVGKADAVLARDRLVLGDVQNQAGDFPTQRAWPTSLDLGGNDAAAYPAPAVVAAGALDEVATALPARTDAGEGNVPEMLRSEDVAKIRAILDRALATGLPRMDSFLLGVAPNRAGAASLIGLIFAGLFLSYRHILRPRSAALFGVCFVLTTAALTFTPAVMARSGALVVWDVVKTFPGEMLTLFNFLLLNSDAPFAAAIILALPGTEPLTARGRRIFLAVAAVGAAALHRLDPATPAATLALCVLMPAAPVFDRVFRQRSWLDRREREIPGRASKAWSDA